MATATLHGEVRTGNIVACHHLQRQRGSLRCPCKWISHLQVAFIWCLMRHPPCGGRLKDVIFRACPYEWCFSSRCSCLPFVLFVVRGFPSRGSFIFLALRSADLKTQETIELWWVVVIHRWQGEPTDGSNIYKYISVSLFFSLSLSLSLSLCLSHSLPLSPYLPFFLYNIFCAIVSQKSETQSERKGLGVWHEKGTREFRFASGPIPCVVVLVDNHNLHR